ncbi:molecular chaperone HtpG [Nakamurella antarctica]|uniref:Chaperone protein HtpG n=1 Tax=Nakamurella antarctica TaxID=1902245 RepID=A0A3G8ZPQ2_9ACTN|nr:molecular chaperone HtpG [Nakamurella antarctica]AZI59253.1 molecular chaperone HtpG [Nakamurella antarctica]
MTAHVEELEFQAETRQLLDLMIHSIYSNKDSFLRELISNSSDALDKLRLEAYRDKDLAVDTSDLHIDIAVDHEARTVTISDNGIGMTRAEVIDLIGTLAKSGTAEVRAKLKEAQKSAAAESASGELIGQFGIGFYSTFMVAETVTLLTRKAGESTATRWVSSGSGTYTIEEVADAPQGSAVTLTLKPADDDDHLFDYTSERKLKELIKRYSDFIAWPIRVETVTETDGEVSTSVETVNSMKALWTRSKDDVSTEEYTEFYRHVSHAWDEPLEVISLKAEGTFEYQALLFIPSRAPFDLFQRESKVGIALYVKRVFIMDDCDDLIPEYLRFVKGVVDAQDLSLNVSREILQQDRQIGAIRRRLTKKVLSTIKDLQTSDTEKFGTIWTEFGRALKEGLLSDHDNQETLLGISLFASTANDEDLTSLASYVERMPESQDKIYYVTGDSRQQIESSPHMEAFKAKGLEVLLLTDPVDEVWVDAVPGFDGKMFQSIAKGEVDLDSEDSAEKEERGKDFASLLTWLTEKLSENVSQVRLSTRLTTSPACIVGDAGSLTPALERMYRAMGQQIPPTKRILEVNPDHPLITGLRTAQSERADDPNLAETAELLYGTALLAEGGDLLDPAKFAKLLADRLTRTV